jgi:hypothetical protein
MKERFAIDIFGLKASSGVFCGEVDVEASRVFEGVTWH